MKHKIVTVAGVAAALVALSATVASASATVAAGPSSSTDPYIVPVTQGVSLTSLLTTGDSVGGYRMAGIPDGLGAFDNGDGTFTLLVNHEIGSTLGVRRAHGAVGAFVAKYTIDKRTLKVVAGEDLMTRVYEYAGGAWSPVTTAFGRFCSGDLAPVSAFYNDETKRGTKARIYLNGEEIGNEGRAVAHVVTGSDAGSSYVLPWLGRSSWENWVAKPGYGDQTVLVGTDDSTPGQVYVYVGTKQRSGNDVERAGLTNGTLYGVVIDGIGTGAAKETDATAIPAGGAAFRLVPLGDVSSSTGAQLQSASVAAGISEMARPEDSSWDPSNARNLYIATTNAFAAKTRLWKLRFTKDDDVLAGGKATIVVEGGNDIAVGPRMFDNITVNERGQVIALEDVGNNAYIGGVYLIDPKKSTATRIAQHNPDLFTPGLPGFLTQDEESSGVIPAPFLGENAYLIDSQVHLASADPELVEGGQLLVLKVGKS